MPSLIKLGSCGRILAVLLISMICLQIGAGCDCESFAAGRIAPSHSACDCTACACCGLYLGGSPAPETGWLYLVEILPQPSLALIADELPARIDHPPLS
jgi:hypothetical protein